MADSLRKYKSLYSSTCNTFATGEGVTITPTSVTGLPTDTEITLTFDRVDSSGTKTPSKMERIRGTVTGGNFVVSSGGRAVEGTEQTHTSPVVEMIWNANDWNDAVDHILTGHNQDGTHKALTLLDGSKYTLGSDADGDLYYRSGGKTVRLEKGTASQQLRMNSGATAPEWFTPSAAASFWTAFSGAYASGTTITVSGVDVTSIFKKGVALKWLSSADALKIGKVVSSSFSTDTTITVVGSTVAAGDKSFYYGADVMSETFIIAGNQSVGTDVSKKWLVKTDIYPISVDGFVGTAGTTNNTNYFLNDDGMSFHSYAFSIASGATTGDEVAATNPTTAIAVDSIITAEIDSASTTQAIDGYITLFYLPVWWINRT